MKKAYWVILVVAVIFLANFFTLFAPLNKPLNKLVAGPPDKTCGVDEDCVIRSTSCTLPCDPGDAVNKNWKRFCPFTKIEMFCEMSAPKKAQCIAGTCTAVEPPQRERK